MNMTVFAEQQHELWEPPYKFIKIDAFKWLKEAEPCSIHAVVTDPPFGLVEYTPDQLEKCRNGNGGVWRLPPVYDGSQRQPVPRFTVLTEKNKKDIRQFFKSLSSLLHRVVVPGAHVFVAAHPLLVHLVIQPFTEAGFESRGILIRQVTTLRGGDRPKNGHDEFPNVTVMPKSCFEPWIIARRPCEGTVKENLRKWRTGGLRRLSKDEPFKDIIRAGPARGKEKKIAPHFSLKPQKFLRPLVRSCLPLGEGVILDPFAGSGSTLAAATSCGFPSIGLENNPEWHAMGLKAIPQLARL